MAGHMYRQMRHGTRPRLRLGLEFEHGQACASLLTFFIYMYNISQHTMVHNGTRCRCTLEANEKLPKTR